MHPSLSPTERPLRRVSSVRSALEAQTPNNSDCFSIITDGKSEKPAAVPWGGEMCSINESESESGHRRNHSYSDLMFRKNRTIASYCLGGVVSLFLLVQIVTGGLSLLSNPVALTGVKQVQAGFIMEKNQVRQEDEASGHWKPVKVPMKEIDSSTVLTNLLRDTQQSLKESTVRPVELRAVGAAEKRSENSHSIDSKLVVGEGTGLEQLGDKQQDNSWFRKPSYNFEQCRDGIGYGEPSQVTDGYLLTFANGGLNQMRTAICDMVAVARVMNATLVIPELDHTSYWADPSKFGDVFDLEHFIRELKNDINIVRELPADKRNVTAYAMAPRSWSETSYYSEEIAPLLKQHGVLRFVLTDSRLANNRIPEEIQRLRCKANYQALKFESSIEELGQKIIQRLRTRGPYIALHLRFEKDMLAFSGCSYGLSAVEAEELRQIRYNVSRWKEKEIDPVSRRNSGGCPLTPHEIGLMLRAMGYPRMTMIYVAAGQIYGGAERMKSFTSLFPNVVTKETIATPEEMKPFASYQNRLAAIDYMVAVDSDVFVPSYDGNMARAVQGHRRVLGHKTTLSPNRLWLVKLLDQYHNSEIDWLTLQQRVLQTHQRRQGSPHHRKPLNPSRVKLEENFYANPLPGCICEIPTPSPTQSPVLEASL